jgi:hypothetical protein
MELVIAAIVTGAFGLLTIMVEKGRRENVKDHGFVKDKLDNLLESIANIDEDVAHIEDKLDTHIHDHLTGQLNDTRADKKKS